MNNYKTTKKWIYREYEIELTYVPARRKDDASIIDTIGADLPDDNGVDESKSHFSAVAIINDAVMAAATGVGQESAIINLYTRLAKNDALRDIEKNVYDL